MLLADGNGEFTKAVGLEMDGSGLRSGDPVTAVRHGHRRRRGHALNVEPGPGLSVSAADAILEAL